VSDISREARSESDGSFVKVIDPALAHLPQRFSSESGSTIEGDEYLDQFGTHHWYREPRPFSVSHESDHFQWTAEDGKRSEIIQQLANNSEMAKYLEKLNVMTEQRQLVYPKELLEQHAAEAFQGKRDTLTLPSRFARGTGP